MEKLGGFLYILTNDAMPGILKIGKTVDDVAVRARQLSNHSGIPMPFKVAYEIFTEYPNSAEMLVHSALHHYRVDLMREFFKIPLNEAIRICDKAVQVLKNDKDYPKKRFPNFAKEWRKEDMKILQDHYKKCQDFKVLSKIMGRTPYELEVFLNSIGEINSTKFPQALPKFKGFPKKKTRQGDGKKFSLEEVKKKYPNAYEKWTKQEEEQLTKMFYEGLDIDELARYFQRKPGGIRARLKKLELID